jgi:hypothetical protein
MAKLRLPPDFSDFLKLLATHEVEYLLIGGYAVGFHGYVRIPHVHRKVPDPVAVRIDWPEFRSLRLCPDSVAIDPLLDPGVFRMCELPLRLRWLLPRANLH